MGINGIMSLRLGEIMKSNSTVVFPEPKHVVVEERSMPVPGGDNMLVQLDREKVGWVEERNPTFKY